MRKLRVVAYSLVTLLAASPLLAVGQGRMFGLVKTQEGEPVAGANITVTCASLPTFKLELMSNDQGKYTVALVDATKTYVYRIEKEGFQPLEEQVKIPIGSNTERDFTLLTPQQLRAAGGAPVVDPAIETYNAGVALLNAGDRPGAIAKFEEAVKLDAELAAGWSALAMVRAQAGEHAAAVAAAEKAVAIDPGDTRALRVQVDGYRALGQDDKAAAAKRALAEADPASAALDFYNQGVDLYNGGQTDQALALFEKSLAADPNYARTHYMLGLCYAGSDTAKAKTHFQTFVEMAPDDPDAATAKEMINYL